MDEITEYKNSEVCQACANCCKVWAFYIDNQDSALRVALIDTPDNEIQIIQVTNDLWKVILDFPCRNLIEKDGEYYCKTYDSLRPDLCKQFPYNFIDQPIEVLQVESRTCTLMNDLIKRREDDGCIINNVDGAVYHSDNCSCDRVNNSKED